ncbi:odorant receptor 30a-like [Toxorhynchites rutilus septentrionalis]|uniref:odorant receptor 30a-like n=1 Tax=Toxorhynchites rutilus septentrionalis TaxID=329112 RepID=UPI0024793F0C|nr:odorant receptor 30a-like [Toxorhynchites rutilus septentrionalis]
MVTTEAYHTMMVPIIALSKVIGVEVWTSDKMFQPMSFVLMGHMLAYNICTACTVYKYSNDAIQLMKITIVCGVGNQLIVKYFIALSKRQKIKFMYHIIEEQIYRRYSDGSNEERTIVEKTTRFMNSLWKLLVTLNVSTLFVFGVWPFYVYYATGEIVPLFMYEIPMTNLDNTLGYVLNLVFHLDTYIIGVMGILLADGFFIIIVLHSLTIVDLFILHMKELEDLLRMDENQGKADRVAEKWKRCLQDHQLATEYLRNTEEIGRLMILIQLFGCIYTICDAMLLLTLTDWYASLCFLIVLFVDVSIFFILGNSVELKIDEMYQRITDLPWNMMTLSQQKEFSCMVHRSQLPLMLTVYGFTPLNFETYMSVLKYLYQFFVMILKYVK